MAKGFFTQGIAVLFKNEIILDDLKNTLGEFPVIREIDASANKDISGPGMLIDFDREQNGVVTVDFLNKKWPDHMGDTKKEIDLFGAWSMGHYGPYAFPGNLERAVQQSWGWPGAADAVNEHKAFARIRLSYIFGAGDDAPVIPQNYEPYKELDFLCSIAQALLQHESALCYFNPNGELLLPESMLEETTDYHSENGIPNINGWTNVRFFNVTEDWHIMDSVGSGQFDIPDQEVCFTKETADPQDISYFIRNIVHYLIDNGEIIKDGDTIDGPGGSKFRASFQDDSVTAPPRNVIRWLPEGALNIPEIFLGKKNSES